MKKGILVIILLFSYSIQLGLCETAEVIKNDLTNDQWIDTTSNVIHNLTLGEISLNGSDIIYWNMSTGWNESPSDTARITLSENGERVNYDIRISGEERFHRQDAGEWDDFIIYFEFYVDVLQTYIDNYRGNWFWSCQSNNDWSAQRVGNQEGWGMSVNEYSSTQFYIYPRELTNGINYGNNTGPLLSVDTQYYIKLVRDGVNCALYCYSDSAYSNEVSGFEGGLSLTLHSDWTLNYMMIVQSLDRSGAYDIEGYVDHITYASGGYSAGYIETGDLLTNATSGIAYNLNLNASIPVGNSLNVSISDDGSSWSNSTIFDDVITTEVIGKYLEDLNLTSLYVRVDYDTDGGQTPSLYDIHLTYLTGGSSGVVTDYRYGIAVVLLILGVLLGIGIRYE